MATVQQELQETRVSLDRFKTSVGTHISNLRDEVAQLRASLENQGQLSADDKATFDAMQAELDAASAEVEGGGQQPTDPNPPADGGTGDGTNTGDTGDTTNTDGDAARGLRR